MDLTTWNALSTDSIVALAWVVLIGFVAQLLGGSLGMAYGVSSSTGLALLGFSPAASSSLIHIVEIGTSLINGSVHFRAKTINWRVVFLIGIPGGIAAFVGAMLLSTFNSNWSKPWTATLLLALGLFILFQFVRGTVKPSERIPHRGWLIPLGAVSGFVDSSAGGGWGVMTTSTLVASRTMTPAQAAGTTSTARLIVAIAGTVGFLIGLGPENIAWLSVVAMLIGGVIAAPVVHVVVKYVSTRVLGIVMGVALVLLNTRQLLVAIGTPIEWVLSAMLLVPVIFLLVFWLITRNRQSRDV